MKKNKIPKFNTIKEEAEFWDTHSIADYLDELKPVDVVYEPTKEKKGLVTLRIAPSLKRAVDKIAKKHSIATSSLIRKWMVDKVKETAEGNDYTY